MRGGVAGAQACGADGGRQLHVAETADGVEPGLPAAAAPVVVPVGSVVFRHLLGTVVGQHGCDRVSREVEVARYPPVAPRREQLVEAGGETVDLEHQAGGRELEARAGSVPVDAVDGATGGVPVVVDAVHDVPGNVHGQLRHFQLVHVNPFGSRAQTCIPTR